MSALGIYRQLLQVRYAADPDSPTKPVYIDVPNPSTLSGVWTAAHPAMWVTFAGFMPTRDYRGPKPGPVHRWDERLILNALAYCNVNDQSATEEALVDRMLIEASYLQAEPAVGIENVNIQQCVVMRIEVGQNKSPAVQAGLEFLASTEATDQDFIQIRTGIPEDFRPQYVELHQLPEGVITRVTLQ